MRIPKKFITAYRLKRSCSIAFCFLVSSCAIKVAPTGGEKDVSPPKILKSSPENYSTSFSQKEIVIGFDEYVQLKDADKQIIISPIINPAPEIAVKNKNVIIKFEKDLLPNTTYTINFGNSIADTHEGNPFENYQYVFSTGPELDSLQVKGRVYFADNLKTEKGILVMLYRNGNDSTPYKSQPDYFTKTDEEGNFLVKNISKSFYKIFALKETDGNFNYNSGDELIAFTNNEVNSSDSVKADLALFKEQPSKLFIKTKAFAEKGKFILTFNRPAQGIALKSAGADSLPVKFEEYSLNRDTLSLWLSDTLIKLLNFTVWENDLLIDTVSVQEKVLASGKGRGDISTASKVTASPNLGNGINPDDTLILYFNQPLFAEKSNLKMISLKKDSVSHIDFKAEFTDIINRKLKVVFKPVEGESYKLVIPPTALTSVYNLTNDSIVFDFSTNRLTTLGSILVKLNGVAEGSYLLQLVNEKDEIMYEQKIQGSGKYLFEYINPMKYKLRLIADTNKNGKWDTGNYLQKIQPEKVFYFVTEINIRANWDLEQDWNIE